MGLTLVTPAATYPVTLVEAKAQCRVTSTDENDYIDGLIAAATGFVESYTGRALVEQAWELTLDAFSDAIMLPRGPVSAVSSVKYSDADGIEQTVSTDDYTVDLASDPQWIVRASGVSWPTTIDAVNAVRVRFVSGYETLPAEIKHAVLLKVQQLHERDADPKIAAAITDSIEAMLCNHRAFA